MNFAIRLLAAALAVLPVAALADASARAADGRRRCGS